MNIPTDPTLPPQNEDGSDYTPHLYQDEVDDDEQKSDLITDEAQTDSPIDLLQVDPKKFKEELDKQAIEGGGPLNVQDQEDIEDYTTLIENSDINSDDPDSKNI
jgi:hypothetical protein